MKYALFIVIMMYGLVCNAGICKHVSGNGETDNRSIFRIQQDVCGYMWFLTYNGINRYDGTSLNTMIYRLIMTRLTFIQLIVSFLLIVKKNCGCLHEMVICYPIIGAVTVLKVILTFESIWKERLCF